ncbi:MAG: hypothetical protein ABIY70_15820, partial [Capsulimonas sp.]|uniref:hypothetical protein n=1 Tax=Capsulimonas sp. TaxID=2494211 RepID=UPI003267F50F
MSKNKCSSALMLILTLALVSDLVAAGATHNSSSTAWNLTQWMSWRDDQIAHILEPTFTDASGVKIIKQKDVISRSQDAYLTIQECLQADPNYFNDDANRSHALGNFVRFVTAQHWMGVIGVVDAAAKNTHALGMPVTDVDYFRIAEPYVRFPDLLKSQDFLIKMANPATYRDALAMIEQHNKTLPDNQKWKAFFFKAQFITTVDTAKTYGRLLVVAPNQAMGASGVADQWIVFGVATPDAPANVEMKSVSIFTVYRRASDVNQTETYFSDFMRMKDATSDQYSIVSNFTLPNNPSHNCYSCHKSSVLPIHPACEYDFDTSGKLVPKTTGVGLASADVNGRISRYGQPNFSPQDTGAYGPGLGPETNPGRSDEFLKAAT